MMKKNKIDYPRVVGKRVNGILMVIGTDGTSIPLRVWCQ